MLSFLKDRNIPLLFVLAPSSVQVLTDLQNGYLSTIGSTMAEFDFEKPQKLLHRWALEHDVEVIDLLPHFKDQPNPLGLFLANDVHWSSRGHAFAAKTVFPILQEKVSNMPNKTGGVDFSETILGQATISSDCSHGAAISREPTESVQAFVAHIAYWGISIRGHKGHQNSTAKDADRLVQKSGF